MRNQQLSYGAACELAFKIRLSEFNLPAHVLIAPSLAPVSRLQPTPSSLS